MKKVESLFLKFDADSDKYLSEAELGQLLQETTGKTMTSDDFHFFCKSLQAKPDKGLTIEHLLLYYVSAGGPGGPDVDADHAKIFTVQGPVPPPAAPATAAKAQEPQKLNVHVQAETTSKVAEIFAHYDKDGDKFLNQAEVSALQKDTEGKGMSEAEYGQFCELLEANPVQGLSVQHLLVTYVALGGDVNADYAKVFPDKVVVEMSADGTYSFD